MTSSAAVTRLAVGAVVWPNTWLVAVVEEGVVIVAAADDDADVDGGAADSGDSESEGKYMFGGDTSGVRSAKRVVTLDGDSIDDCCCCCCRNDNGDCSGNEEAAERGEKWR